MSASVEETTVARLLEAYDALLLDAYGVLVDGQGPLPGAVELVDHLNATQQPYLVLTNDASKLAATSAARFAGFGLQLPEDRIITSGSLLGRYFEQRSLVGAPCAVLGPPDSHAYVRSAGGEIVDWDDSGVSRVEALIIGDEVGFDFILRMNQALSLLYQRMDAGSPVRLILPNPDLVYPAGPSRFGFTAGAMAMWLEAALALRYPEAPLQSFDRLGKPYPAIFEAAVERTGTRNVVMIGDQLDTDIQGARWFGIDSVLVTFGLTRQRTASAPADLRPTFVMHGWCL